MANLVNAERIGIAFGTRVLLDEVSLGLDRGDVIGVVGRNGDGKTTLLRILTGTLQPDSGRVTRAGATSIGYLHQTDDFAPAETVRSVIVGGADDHVWAADPVTRPIVQHLLGDVDLDATISTLSGGERRRTALVQLMLAGHDLLVLDEPTNHLDVEAVAWLADHLRALQAGKTAMLVVSHDRWFLDAICTRIWEVHDGVVDGYDGGYAAYVLARAERGRQAVQVESRRANLLRKELAWLRRGAPARTSKPRFRTEAANALIEDEPPPRDTVELRRLSTNRLGKDVFDLHRIRLSVGEGDQARDLIKELDWSIGPGMRIGLIGVNGAGKTTLLRLLAGDRKPDAGTIKRGRTITVGELSQNVAELDERDRVLESVSANTTQLASGKEVSATTLLEDFGFTGDRLTARIGDLSGGERRRLQFLRILLSEPNVLLLDEPTNDLDIDTLTVIEDYLDNWPGTLIVVSHDRYFLERVCDVTYALMGDGRCVLLPGGVDQYLDHRRNAPAITATTREPETEAAPAAKISAAEERQTRKDLARIEQRLQRAETAIRMLHDQMAESAADYQRLAELQRDLDGLTTERDTLELEWLEAAERLS